MSAKSLKVVVRENNNEKVNLTFPIFTLTCLADVMPAKVLESLKSKNIDPESIVKKIKSDGNQPQVIFEMSEGPKNYKVWIEQRLIILITTH